MNGNRIKKIELCLLGGIVFSFLFMGAYGQQPARMTWEQAGIQAARENKLVFVAVGMEPDRKIFSEEEVHLFFTRNTVGMVIDMEGEAGKQFEPRLLLTPYPVYAFFMPFGDLLITVDPEEAARNPQRLLDAGAEALRLAEMKKTNSRELRFLNLSGQEILKKGQSEEKPVLVYFRSPACRECLWMENNVFNLDRVADFYNRNFVSRQVTVTSGDSLSELYGIEKIPVFLFLTGEGKELYRSEGLLSAEDMITEGGKVLEINRGIAFRREPWEKAMQKARAEGKYIFVDTYITSGGDRRKRAGKLFRDPEVARFFEKHFVSFDYDNGTQEGKNFREYYGIRHSFALCFFDKEGRLLHRVSEIGTPEELIREARSALEGKGLTFMKEQYEKGERTDQFLERYIGMLVKAGEKEKAGKVTAAYLERLSPDCLKTERYWDLFRNYFADVTSPLFEWVYARKIELYPLYGKETVERKINEIWAAGAESFVKGEEEMIRFDENGFREYAKRLKKEKVAGRNGILRKARMKAAEKTGDWKTFSELAEERWNEEDIPETELYEWGITLEENCRDKSIRYKAARWFALTAAEMERKERLAGKVNVSSYKGFFEKLVNDLVEK